MKDPINCGALTLNQYCAKFDAYRSCGSGEFVMWPYKVILFRGSVFPRTLKFEFCHSFYHHMTQKSKEKCVGL